jgi:Cyclophilin type peptidyl-prolyl cis-trans isomerase/CLD
MLLNADQLIVSALVAVCTLRRRAYFELDVAGESAGRVEVELATDILPVTCRNFLELCAGTAKLPDGTPLSYKVQHCNSSQTVNFSCLMNTIR